MSLDSNRILEVMDVLVGDVLPIGESNYDELVLKNLNTLTEIAEAILAQLQEIKFDTDGRKEGSISECNRVASSFLNKYNLID